MLTELCVESLAWIGERSFVVSKSGFKGVFSEAYVGLVGLVVFSNHCCLIDNGFFEAIAGHRAAK